MLILLNMFFSPEHIETVLNLPELYPEFKKRLFDEDFALKKEYYAVREYFEDLKKRHSQPHEDVFALL